MKDGNRYRFLRFFRTTNKGQRGDDCGISEKMDSFKLFKITFGHNGDKCNVSAFRGIPICFLWNMAISFEKIF